VNLKYIQCAKTHKNVQKRASQVLTYQKNMHLKVSSTKKRAKTCKKRAKTCKRCKNVHLKCFWTLFKNMHCQGPCILRPCISRPYCIPLALPLVTSYIPLSWNKETPLQKSNFLSSQMVSHRSSPSFLPLLKSKWVQLNGKTFQVLKNSLFTGGRQFWRSIGSWEMYIATRTSVRW
jgi:hypothetical protein